MKLKAFLIVKQRAQLILLLHLLIRSACGAPLSKDYVKLAILFDSEEAAMNNNKMKNPVENIRDFQKREMNPVMLSFSSETSSLPFSTLSRSSRGSEQAPSSVASVGEQEENLSLLDESFDDAEKEGVEEEMANELLRSAENIEEDEKDDPMMSLEEPSLNQNETQGPLGFVGKFIMPFEGNFFNISGVVDRKSFDESLGPIKDGIEEKKRSGTIISRIGNEGTTFSSGVTSQPKIKEDFSANRSSPNLLPEEIDSPEDTSDDSSIDEVAMNDVVPRSSPLSVGDKYETQETSEAVPISSLEQHQSVQTDEHKVLKATTLAAVTEKLKSLVADESKAENDKESLSVSFVLDNSKSLKDSENSMVVGRNRPSTQLPSQLKPLIPPAALSPEDNSQSLKNSENSMVVENNRPSSQQPLLLKPVIPPAALSPEDNSQSLKNSENSMVVENNRPSSQQPSLLKPVIPPAALFPVDNSQSLKNSENSMVVENNRPSSQLPLLLKPVIPPAASSTVDNSQSLKNSENSMVVENNRPSSQLPLLLKPVIPPAASSTVDNSQSLKNSENSMVVENNRPSSQLPLLLKPVIPPAASSTVDNSQSLKNSENSMVVENNRPSSQQPLLLKPVIPPAALSPEDNSQLLKNSENSMVVENNRPSSQQPSLLKPVIPPAALFPVDNSQSLKNSENSMVVENNRPSSQQPLLLKPAIPPAALFPVDNSQSLKNSENSMVVENNRPSSQLPLLLKPVIPPAASSPVDISQSLKNSENSMIGERIKPPINFPSQSNPVLPPAGFSPLGNMPSLKISEYPMFGELTGSTRSPSLFKPIPPADSLSDSTTIHSIRNIDQNKIYIIVSKIVPKLVNKLIRARPDYFLKKNDHRTK